MVSGYDETPRLSSPPPIHTGKPLLEGKHRLFGTYHLSFIIYHLSFIIHHLSFTIHHL